MSNINSADRQHMQHALRLAAMGLNTTTPNPCVGCVIVDTSNQVIGEGWHKQAGGPHAEIVALDSLSDAELAKGATVYVTLEPCSHTGQTGPCCDALINAGIARVVYAMEDPNPQVAGRGLAKLKASGVEVDGPLNEDEARELIPGFIKRMQYGMPYIRIKSAMSVDGRTAMASGESKWITAPAAREDVQHLRARSCALVTGLGSVEHDDPSLTVRLGENDRQPLRVIVDTHAKCPKQSQVLHKEGRTVIACSENASIAEDDTREFWRFPEKQGRVNLTLLVKRLAEEGCNEVLVETGAKLAGAFVNEALVDEFIVYIAPKFLGSSARPLFELPIKTMSGSLPLIIKDIRAVGYDWRMTAIPDPDS